MALNTEFIGTRIMDLLIDAVCVVDAEGRFVFVSAACERIFGYTPDEMIGMSMIHLVHPDDRQRTLEAAGDIMRGQAQMHFENRYVRKDGRIVDIMWSARWSEPEGIRLAVARDITLLKHAERIQSAIYRISEAAHLAEGLSELYQHIHRVICDLLPVDNFLVALYDDTCEALSFPYVADDQAIGAMPGPLDTGNPIATVIREGRAVLYRFDVNDDAEAPVVSLPGKTQDWLGVPLTSQAGVLGAVVVQSYVGSARYQEQDKELLQFVSTQVATAIERKQAEISLHQMARYDPLTGLPNRALFNAHVDMALQVAQRQGDQFALLYLDLDEFKEVNDTLGHEAGDQVLCEVARRLVQCVRDSDMIGRMGGDEFTVLLTNIRGEDAVGIVMDKIRKLFDEPIVLPSRAATLSTSIGAALYPDHGTNRDQLFRHADADMYAAKRAQAAGLQHR
ncbi:GGDEF domain-containing protein [Halomonas sp. 25-S5]|uniref:sensor domain-containing protein n=1 Tax=Halomonas sp. 25-S5 TaxID=2994065 RepID=UPI002468BCB6|nr:GGDEF domain-containing protein [Halomonas sp. 25-S5]